MGDSPMKCVICLQKCGSKVKSKTNNNAGETVEAFDVDVIFILRRVLELPQVKCETFLKKNGNPSEWGISLCSSCTFKYQDKVKDINERIIDLQGTLKGIREEIKGHLMASEEETKGQSHQEESKQRGRPKRGKRKAPNDEVFKCVRSFLLEQYDSKVNGTVNGLNTPLKDHRGVDEYMSQKNATKAFATLGPGRKLTDELTNEPKPGPSSGINNNALSSSIIVVKSLLSEEKQKAAASALARLEHSSKPPIDLVQNRHAAVIKEQVRKELEKEAAERNTLAVQNSVAAMEIVPENATKVEKKFIDPSEYIVKSVLYKCPLFGPEKMKKEEMDKKIRESLLKQLKDDDDIASCLLIKSCNPKAKVDACVGLLVKILNNIIEHPEDKKYYQIKCTNPSLQEKVVGVLGAEQFLKAAGFIKDLIPVPYWQAREEEHWVLDHETTIPGELIELRDMLLNTEPILLELDRQTEVLCSSQVEKRKELPDEFYTLSVEEVRAEQRRKTDITERELTLRTKATRDKDEKGPQRHYKFAVIRIKFPDSKVLQGMFRASEPLTSIFKFIRENLLCEHIQFDLIRPGTDALNDATIGSINELGLAPSTLLIFNADQKFLPEGYLSGELPYLKPELQQH